MNLSARELALIESLRAEANSVKDCFARYSLQGLTFASAMLGVTFKFQADGATYVGYVRIVVIIILLTLAKDSLSELMVSYG